jgi:hypothetical protein
MVTLQRKPEWSGRRRSTALSMVMLQRKPEWFELRRSTALSYSVSSSVLDV